MPKEARTILDVGCGAGLFGEALKEEREVEVWGIEVVKEMADQANQRLDRCIIANIEGSNIKLPDGYFDCIVCNDILEHLIDPLNVLRYLKSKLTVNGVVVASIPNVRFFKVVNDLLLNKQWEYKESGVLDKGHLRFFTEKGIRNLFEKSGYEIIRMEGINRQDFKWKFKLLNFACMNSLNDMRFLQFACVATPRK